MTQTSLTREDIYGWNNVGIYHLQARRLDDSIHCFRMALSVAKSRVLHEENGQTTNTAVSNPSKTDTRTRNAFEDTPIDGSSIVMASMVSFMEGRTDDLHHDYLHMQPQPLHSQDPETPIARVCVTCLFNLALAMHLKAMSLDSETQDSERFAAVLQLYDNVYTLLLSMEMAATCSNKGDLHLLLAVLNNMALLHNQFGRSDKAKACFETLLSSLMFINAFDGSRCETLESSLLDGVLSNISKALGILTAPIYAPGA